MEYRINTIVSVIMAKLAKTFFFFKIPSILEKISVIGVSFNIVYSCGQHYNFLEIYSQKGLLLFKRYLKSNVLFLFKCPVYKYVYITFVGYFTLA